MTHPIKDGLYGIHFQNAGVDCGSGTIVLRDGSLNGGDPGFYYCGNLLCQSQEPDHIPVSIDMEIRKWNPAIPSVIPGVNNYLLNVRGRYQLDTAALYLEGETSVAPGIKLQIMAFYIAPLHPALAE